MRRCVCAYVHVCVNALSVCAWMRVNGALQECWPSIGDECADMTVIHGDVYSKPREAERPDLRGIKRKKEGKWKKHPMFLLNSIKDKKIARVYMNEWGQFIHLSLSVFTEAVRSVWYHQSNVVIMWADNAYWHGWLMFSTCSNSQRTQPNTPTPPQHKHTERCMCSLSRLIPSHYCRQSLQCLCTSARFSFSMQSESQTSHTQKKHTHMRSYTQAQKSAVNTRLLRN